MPATRSRHGSRQPQPYGVEGGPANPIPVLPASAVEVLPLQKPVVERKARQRSKQKQKQKARLPLPPDTDIIEISSDEDENRRAVTVKKPSSSVKAHGKRIAELEEETKKLKAALAAAKAIPQTPPHADILKVQSTPASDLNLKYTKLLSTMEDEVNCEVCTLKMWHPYILACGHTFCKTCLQDWFSTAHIQHLASHPSYDLNRLVPLNIRNALARGNLPSHDRRILEREMIMRISSTEHPQYSCPTCRVLVRVRPAENFVIKHLVRTIAAAQGESPPKEPALIPGQVTDRPFDGFFPSFVCML